MEGMTKTGVIPIVLMPCAEGWAVWRGAKREHIAATLAEAAAFLPAGQPTDLAVPTQGLVIERLRLPATAREELAGMVRLQQEKTLPLPAEEICGDFAILQQESAETTVLAVAVPEATLQNLCQPLRERAIAPRGLSPMIGHVAAACPGIQTVLVVYVESGSLVLAVVENQRPGWVHLFPTRDPAEFSAELPQLLLAATLEGVPTTFAQVLLAPEAAACEPALRQCSEAPVAPLPPLEPATDPGMDLLPPTWRLQSEQKQRWQKLRGRLLAAAAVYLFIGAAAWAHLLFLNRQARRLEAELAALRPKLELIQEHQARSTALAAAIDPHRYTVELLYLIERWIPAAHVRLTEFEQAPAQWRIVGEAPSAAQAVQYVSRLKEDEELSAYRINADPPQLLAGERAQFSIFGKP